MPPTATSLAAAYPATGLRDALIRRFATEFLPQDLASNAWTLLQDHGSGESRASARLQGRWRVFEVVSGLHECLMETVPRALPPSTNLSDLTARWISPGGLPGMLISFPPSNGPSAPVLGAVMSTVGLRELRTATEAAGLVRLFVVHRPSVGRSETDNDGELREHTVSAGGLSAGVPPVLGRCPAAAETLEELADRLARIGVVCCRRAEGSSRRMA